MEMNKRDETPVIWRATHEESKRRWKNGLIVVNLFYLTVIASMGLLLIQDGKRKELAILQGEELGIMRTRESIYSILRNRGVSLGQGLDIAEVTIRQSKKLNLSMALILAVMKKESEFIPYALSSKSAMGIMQVHPITWDEYVGKLNLKVSAHAAFDPATNIIVATHVLKDLYEYYKRSTRSEEEIWKSVLSAYYAGVTSFSQTGMTESHAKYVADVTTFKGEFDEKLQD
ncbi:MAG: lytic transglycosylase domain-containing protein [Thermodesulfobacteriota bacterium]